MMDMDGITIPVQEDIMIMLQLDQWEEEEVVKQVAQLVESLVFASVVVLLDSSVAEQRMMTGLSTLSRRVITKR